MKYALRGLSRNPGYSAIIVLLFALGIGANLLIFSVVDVLLLRRLPVREPSSLVQVVLQRPNNIPNTGFPFVNVQFLRARSRTLAAVFAAEPLEMSFQSDGRMENVQVRLVSGNHADALGIQPALGRLLRDADEADPTPRAVVLSHRFWMTAFGGRSDAVGREVRLRGLPFTVVGVLPAGYNGMEVDEALDVEMPISAVLRWSRGPWYTFAPCRMYARLAPGANIEQARAEFGTLYPALVEDEIARTPGTDAGSAQDARNRAFAHKPWLIEAGGGVSTLRAQFSLAVKALMGAVGMLLLLVCANVGGLMLVRSESRRQEIAIRLSLGANRWEVLRLALGEAAVLVGFGLAGAFAIARLGGPWLLAQLPSRRPLSVDLAPDWRILAYGAAACLLSVVFVSIAPALHAMRMDLSGMMGRGGSRVRRSRTAYAFVAVQVMLATVLTIGGAALVRTLDRLRNADIGFERERLVVIEANPGDAGVKYEDRAALYTAMLEQARRIPSVEGASLAVGRLMQGVGLKTTVAVTGVRPERNDLLNSSLNEVSANYLESMGMRVIAGRGFVPGDANAKAPRAVVVTRSFARRFFGTEDALGRTFGTGFGKVAAADCQVVGIVADTKYRSMREQTPPIFYAVAGDGIFPNGATLHVRVRGDAAATIAELRRMLAGIGPGLVPVSIATMEEEVGRSVWRERLIAWLAGAFAVLAAFLAAVGLYGMLAQSTRRRTREFGIRIALGATTQRILALVARDVALCVVPGLAAGGLVYLGCSRAIVPLLYGVKALDAGIAAGAIALLVAVAMAAGAMPARRAGRIQPTEALRDQ